MKRKLLALIVCAICTSVCNKGIAQTILLDYWNFNNMAPAATDTFKPYYSAPGATAGSFSYSCAYIDYVSPGGSLNLQPGDTAGSCIRFRNPSDSFVLHMPTTGYGNIHLSYEAERTTNGAQNNSVNYTTDGVHFIPSSATDIADSTTYTLQLNTFTLYTFNFSGDPLTKNNPNFAVSIVFQNGNTNPSGNDRYDNITLKGDPLSGLSVANTYLKPEYTLYPNPATNELNIATNTETEKSVVISNAVGQRMFATSISSNTAVINTSTFCTGIYYVTITETLSGTQTTMKFIKM